MRRFDTESAGAFGAAAPCGSVTSVYKTERDARVIFRTRERDSIPLSELAPNSIMQLRVGAYVLPSEWAEMFSEGRLRTRARAVTRRTSAVRATISHTAAAAAHRLPVYRGRSDRVDMILPGPNARRNGGDIVRHHHPLPDADVVVIDGMRVTTLDRTVYDVIRTSSVETAVVCFDAALRQVAWSDARRSYDVEAAAAFRRRLIDRIGRNAGARGIRQARFVTDFADGRAQLPGESIARLWMHQLGVPTPELQYRVDFSDGGFALLDFAWPKRRRWAEFDGEFKYTDPELLAGRTAEQVIADQNERAFRVWQETGWDVNRFGFDRMLSIDAFADYLRSIGL